MARANLHLQRWETKQWLLEVKASHEENIRVLADLLRHAKAPRKIDGDYLRQLLSESAWEPYYKPLTALQLRIVKAAIKSELADIGHLNVKLLLREAEEANDHC